MDDLLNQMRCRVLKHAPNLVPETAIRHLGLAVFQRPTIPIMTLCSPMVCIVLQGVKQVLIGGTVLRFEAASCFASTIELPAMGRILEADVTRPYVAVALTINQDCLAALVSEVEGAGKSRDYNGFGVEMATVELLESVDSLLSLLDTPSDIPVLRAGREREVLYRLLQSGHGNMLRRSIQRGNGSENIRRAIEWIRQNLDQSLSTDALSTIAGMSIPSFHRHFKEMTSMSPLQYQKTLRLQAARRLLLTSSNTTQAGFAVGYESASQFSREYSRLFGISPSRDAIRMRVDSKSPIEYMF